MKVFIAILHFTVAIRVYSNEHNSNICVVGVSILSAGFTIFQLDFGTIPTVKHFYAPAPRGGGGYTVLPLSVCPSFRPSKIFFVTFFSVTVDGRNMIFGQRFWTRQIPTSCLPTQLISIHIEHICTFLIIFFS